MAQTIPVQDQRWVSKALFHAGRLRTDLQLWYDPPATSYLARHQAPPVPNQFFTHGLMVWMPHFMWKLKLNCPNCETQLIGCGVYEKARKVLDIDRYYLLVTEILRCPPCSVDYLSTSQALRDQLDLPHQMLFRVVMTTKYACDIRVIRLLRDKTLGSIGPARLAKQLRESHGEERLTRLARYLRECADHVERLSLLPQACLEPPEASDVPTSQWLLSAYGRDILSRLDHIRASITSTFGTVLHIISTEKITKKLSGYRDTWLTSIGNEAGQILNSVVTRKEDSTLDKMAAGLVRRYRQAAVPPPVVLYVDRGCCPLDKIIGKPTMPGFTDWPELQVRLDAWHFMKWLARSCLRDHALYPAFMSRLAACIFEWDAGDLTLLRQAKKHELMLDGWTQHVPDHVVDSSISRKELSQFCRRRTRGVEVTTRLIDQLLQETRGPKWTDHRGVPFRRRYRWMDEDWSDVRPHVRCIQDVPGVQLYTEVGYVEKPGGVTLTRYRCARGSETLQAFHLHLNKFIPGTCANELNSQLYLLECLNRWNYDRGAAAVSSRQSSLMAYAGDMVQHVNTNYLKLFGRPLVPGYRPPAKYTGELLGLEFLLSETGEPLQVIPDTEETNTKLEAVDVGEEEEEEIFEDTLADMTVSSVLDDQVLSQLARTRMEPPTTPPSLQSAFSMTAPSHHSVSSQPLASSLAVSSQPVASSLAVSSHPAAFYSSSCSSSSMAGSHSSQDEDESVRVPAVEQMHILDEDDPVGVKVESEESSLTLTDQQQLNPPEPHPGPAVSAAPQMVMFGPVSLKQLPFLMPRSQHWNADIPTPPSPPCPRPYARKMPYNTCKKCGKSRTTPTGHSQYKGKVYCPTVESVSKEQWLEDMKKKE
ncbi:uncharacterized protein LOC134456175 [Engraulis encrasicolus]|uniref:uncharacterized protein LOC134456175 n=1 Tax=Engraulis encrasicolus TaxID=184585 RepID=UPI002FD38ED6